jgi:hypothetical protein
MLCCLSETPARAINISPDEGGDRVVSDEVPRTLAWLGSTGVIRLNNISGVGVNEGNALWSWLANSLTTTKGHWGTIDALIKRRVRISDSSVMRLCF